MKIIGINSGRINGYSRKILEDIVNNAGVEFELINLAEKTVRGCLGCLKCAGNNTCIQKDDFQEIVKKVITSDALVFAGSNYYGTLNAIGHAFWERTFALRHQETFQLAGKLGVAVGMDRNPESHEATKFIEKMMLSNKMAVVATIADPGRYQCYDCGYGHNCVAGNVYALQGLVSAKEAQEGRPDEYTCKSQDRAKAIGKMLGSILSARSKM